MPRRSPHPGAARIARERIAVLFVQADRFFAIGRPEWSDRCVALARRIAMRQRVRIDRVHRRRFCQHCYGFLVPGVNERVRVHRGKVVVTCARCHRQTRFIIRRSHAGD
ncbi:MAG: ribonuclease P [Methanoregulaceae archaeon]|nr:ribonuclease P [Methanoregulaceae archaeon]